MRGQSMADELVGTTLVIVHRPVAPDPAEWNVHCGEIAARRGSIRGVIVLASGPGPNTMQRKQLTEAWGGDKPPPVAIITRSAVLRGVLTALNWFMANQLKPFSDGDFDGAFAHICLPTQARSDVLAALRRLTTELDVPLSAGSGSSITR